MIITNNKQQIEVSNIWIGLFTNESKYGLAAVAKEKIQVKTLVKHRYWVIDIFENKFSYECIVKNLIEWENKYNENIIIKNENEPVTKFLKEELAESYPKNRIYFRDYEFNPNHSIQALKGLMNDKKINVLKNIQNSFSTALNLYDVDDNQVATINAVMIALDKSYEKNLVRRAPATSFSE